MKTDLRHLRHPDVVLVHYADLSNDLEGEMRRIAGRLGIDVAASRWPGLVEAASFPRMADRAAELVPGQPVRSSAAFFRGGRSGDGARLLGAGELARYHERARGELSEEAYAWLHRP